MEGEAGTEKGNLPVSFFLLKRKTGGKCRTKDGMKAPENGNGLKEDSDPPAGKEDGAA